MARKSPKRKTKPSAAASRKKRLAKDAKSAEAAKRTGRKAARAARSTAGLRPASLRAAGKAGAAKGRAPERVAAILQKLDEAYPDAHCELNHRNAYELVVATILSAQCTDKRVNLVTPGLFAKYPTPAHLATAHPGELEQEIRSTGTFRMKAKSLLGASKRIVENFGGQVPQTMDELLTLPGVARKTANVVLGTAFGIPSGIVVDTHVMRLSQRLDLTRETDPKKIEQDLLPIIPQEKWIQFSHQIIWHGRRVCHARKPKCLECNLREICYSKDKTA